MAVSKAEKLSLLFKDDLIEGRLPKLPVALEETQEETYPYLPATSTVNSTSIYKNEDIPYTPASGEDIEAVGYSSNNENVPAAASTTASGERNVKKKGKYGSTATAVDTTAVEQTGTSDSTPDPGLQLGELAPLGVKFCPVLAVSRYPYRHVGKDLSEIVASSYFNAGKFWERTWDM